MKVINAFKCDYCSKLYRIQRFALQHELRCSKNPVNFRDCFGCLHLTKKGTVIYEDSPLGGQMEIQKELLYCQKKAMYVWPAITEHKGNFISTGESEGYMPKVGECRDKE